LSNGSLLRALYRSNAIEVARANALLRDDPIHLQLVDTVSERERLAVGAGDVGELLIHQGRLETGVERSQ
jgi:hypothetical protein